MTQEKLTAGFQDFDRKFGIILFLLILIEGFLGFMLYFIYENSIFLWFGIVLIICGGFGAFLFRIKKFSKMDLREYELWRFICAIIGFSFTGIMWWFLAIPEIAVKLFLSCIPFSWAGMFTIWTVILYRKKKKEGPPCPNCFETTKYISEDKRYYCEHCQKYFKRKN